MNIANYEARKRWRRKRAERRAAEKRRRRPQKIVGLRVQERAGPREAEAETRAELKATKGRGHA